MTTHLPKWNALHALHEGLLSQEGQRRIRAHVDSCSVCARALGAMSLYAGVSDEARRQPAHTGSDAWDRLAAAIARDVASVEGPDHTGRLSVGGDSHASEPAVQPPDEGRAEPDPVGAYERISSEIRLTPAPPIPIALADRVLERRARERDEHGWALAATLAAAACFALATRLFGVGQAPADQPEVPLAHTEPAAVPEQPAQAPSPVVDVHVRAMSGTPRRGDEPLQLGARVEEGQRCQTGEHDSAHFSVGEGSAFALNEDGVATVERARMDGVVLSVERGALSSSVRTGTPYRVLAPPYAFEVRGTRFSVARRDDGAVSARVAEGSVAVMRGSELIVILGPGDVWSSGGEPFAPEPRVWSPEGGVALHVPAPERSPFVTFEADSVIWDAQSDVVLTVREGASLHLTFFDARGRATEMDTQPVAEGATIEAPVPTRVVRGHLPASVLSSVVRQHRGDLDFCVSRAVRMAAHALEEVTLRLTITPEGTVSDVQLTGPGASLPLRACMTAKARGWVFPRPGGVLPVQTQMRLAITPR
ncbi:MAG: FecR domain-containing protein [Myxococcales bacterium]|nr:FecR domain-containing protein [Myxococcales bacterium]MCB9627990.1 FecR domain-containing protein [Sandaracinaceae bacterium]